MPNGRSRSIVRASGRTAAERLTTRPRRHPAQRLRPARGQQWQPLQARSPRWQQYARPHSCVRFSRATTGATSPDGPLDPRTATDTRGPQQAAAPSAVGALTAAVVRASVNGARDWFSRPYSRMYPGLDQHSSRPGRSSRVLPSTTPHAAARTGRGCPPESGWHRRLPQPGVASRAERPSRSHEHPGGVVRRALPPLRASAPAPIDSAPGRLEGYARAHVHLGCRPGVCVAVWGT